MKKKKKKLIPKVWTSRKADVVFSKFIRERDGKCVRCGKKENLQNSHYWSRRYSSTRYDPENCIALCASCHIFNWELEKQGEYRDYMINKLGKKGYEQLRIKAHTTVKRETAIKAFMNYVKSSGIPS